MDLGVLYQANPDMLPHEFARSVEEHGLESVWYPEHTHIPVSHEEIYPDRGEPLAPSYRQFMDPLVSMAAAAVCTTRIRLGTAICLLTQRDPIIAAKELASIDVLSGGRVTFGAAPGWNLQELRDHGVDPDRRFAILREYVLAMKAIWTHEEASFDGRYVSFPPMWQEPKPVQSPHPPILVGGDGPTVEDRVLGCGDGWILNNRRHEQDNLFARIKRFHQRGEAEGYGALPVTLVGVPLDRDVILRMHDAGVSRGIMLIRPTPFDPPDMRRLERLAEINRTPGG